MKIASHNLVAIVLAVSALSQGSAFGADKEPSAPAEVLAPKEGMLLEGIDHVCKGRLNGAANGKLWPVVLIRPLVAGQPYYVQQPVGAVTNGTFFAPVNVGDDQTPPGTKFVFVVVLAKDRQAAQTFEPNSQFQTLPDLPQSDPVIVTRSK
jgi:hypothetical protein